MKERKIVFFFFFCSFSHVKNLQHRPLNRGVNRTEESEVIIKKTKVAIVCFWGLRIVAFKKKDDGFAKRDDSQKR